MKRVFCILALAVAACSPKGMPPARQAADEFFLKIGEERLQEAYDETSFGFKAESSFKNFQAIAKELGLTAGTVSCHWTKEEPKGEDMKLTGEVTTASGTAIPLSVTCVKERGAWRIFSMLTSKGKKEEDRFSLLGKGGDFSSSANLEIPPRAKLEELTARALTLFGNAVRRQNFGEFYSKVSTAWQSQLTERQLKAAFQPFIDARVDIDLNGLAPVFDKPPEINSEGILVLTGHYDTKPYTSVFRLRFIYEFPQWKLYGVELELRN